MSGASYCVSSSVEGLGDPSCLQAVVREESIFPRRDCLLAPFACKYLKPSVTAGGAVACTLPFAAVSPPAPDIESMLEQLLVCAIIVSTPDLLGGCCFAHAGPLSVSCLSSLLWHK